jgi:opacity protein-like surface antigen
MITRARILIASLALAGASTVARADAPDDSLSVEMLGDTTATTVTPRTHDGLEPLTPSLADRPYHLSPGERPYLHRLSFSPAVGMLGNDHLYALRVAYSPNAWLAYEGSIAHDPNHEVHAIIHSLNVILRRPMPGRFQPYLTGGYGMTVVLPSGAIAAQSVTKNVLMAGGGLEWFVRDDLALRGELRSATAFGHQPNHEGMAAYDYFEQTLGLAFYRTLRP